MAANTNATESNSLPVIYSLNSSTAILSQCQHYLYYNIIESVCLFDYG